jgi:hypothetical protein
MEWIMSWNYAKLKPDVDAAAAALKADGLSKMGIIGALEPGFEAIDVAIEATEAGNIQGSGGLGGKGWGAGRPIWGPGPVQPSLVANRCTQDTRSQLCLMAAFRCRLLLGRVHRHGCKRGALGVDHRWLGRAHMSTVAGVARGAEALASLQASTTIGGQTCALALLPHLFVCLCVFCRRRVRPLAAAAARIPPCSARTRRGRLSSDLHGLQHCAFRLPLSAQAAAHPLHPWHALMLQLVARLLHLPPPSRHRLSPRP